MLSYKALNWNHLFGGTKRSIESLLKPLGQYNVNYEEIFSKANDAWCIRNSNYDPKPKSVTLVSSLGSETEILQFKVKNCSKLTLVDIDYSKNIPLKVFDKCLLVNSSGFETSSTNKSSDKYFLSSSL